MKSGATIGGVAGIVALSAALFAATGCDRLMPLDSHSCRSPALAEERALELRVRLYHLSNPHAEAGEIDSYREMLKRTMQLHAAEQDVLLRLAEENRCAVDDQEVAAHLRPIGKVLALLTAEERRDVTALGRMEALCAKAKAALVDKCVTAVTDEQIDEVAEKRNLLAAAAAETNRLVRVRADDVWRRLADGNDFAALAKEFNEADEAPDFRWGTYTVEDLSESPDLQNAVGALRVGQCTRPVEGDNGLMIARCTAIEDADGMRKYTLDRIFFRLAEDVPCFTREELRLAVAQNMADEFVHHEVNRLLTQQEKE